MDKPEEYIKFMTGKMVDYIEMPTEQRKEKRKKAKAAKEPWLTRWFGLGGFAIAQWLQARDKSDGEPIIQSIEEPAADSLYR
ncbi:YqzE family protein [Paenibacillus lycopersici]|uniref:YqzE family protein n=1 Tax=Paenibacillus lycopersici TaxID=2704462 RepID=A0A6C0FXX6_9BACL|nr:YqzE family protein [Paenibacillus lycopersici]QHT61948.1 YqzE family protein [Paenibacillus lycopersici]